MESEVTIKLEECFSADIYGLSPSPNHNFAMELSSLDIIFFID